MLKVIENQGVYLSVFYSTCQKKNVLEEKSTNLKKIIIPFVIFINFIYFTIFVLRTKEGTSHLFFTLRLNILLGWPSNQVIAED